MRTINGVKIQTDNESDSFFDSFYYALILILLLTTMIIYFIISGNAEEFISGAYKGMIETINNR